MYCRRAIILMSVYICVHIHIFANVLYVPKLEYQNIEVCVHFRYYHNRLPPHNGDFRRSLQPNFMCSFQVATALAMILCVLFLLTSSQFQVSTPGKLDCKTMYVFGDELEHVPGRAVNAARHIQRSRTKFVRTKFVDKVQRIWSVISLVSNLNDDQVL